MKLINDKKHMENLDNLIKAQDRIIKTLEKTIELLYERIEIIKGKKNGR